MGRHEKTKDLSESDLRRLTGAKPQTFEKMPEILKRAFAKRRNAYNLRCGFKERQALLRDTDTKRR